MPDEKNVFQKIIDREVSADIVYEDDDCLAFHDINPQAPVHVLVIPRRAIASLADVEEADAPLIGRLFLVTRRIAEQLGLENGFRTVINAGPDGGQEVPHLHIHLLGKRRLTWPPG